MENHPERFLVCIRNLPRTCKKLNYTIGVLQQIGKGNLSCFSKIIKETSAVTIINLIVIHSYSLHIYGL